MNPTSTVDRLGEENPKMLRSIGESVIRNVHKWTEKLNSTECLIMTIPIPRP